MEAKKLAEDRFKRYCEVFDLPQDLFNDPEFDAINSSDEWRWRVIWKLKNNPDAFVMIHISHSGETAFASNEISSLAHGGWRKMKNDE
ncbi:MAG: hypothetical protein QM627_05290 [Luteolibacter sp.]